MGLTRYSPRSLHGAATLRVCLFTLYLISACSTDTKAVETRSQGPDPTSTSAPSATPMLEPDELDLREANVLAVDFEPLEEGQFRFNVTLLHDDEGEAPDFADWWQVEDTQGNLLGRRILLHSHGTQAFTRSEIIAIPADVTVVIVRGHDMQHGHGGQSMRIDLESGLAIPFDEGEEGLP